MTSAKERKCHQFGEKMVHSGLPEYALQDLGNKSSYYNI